MKYRITEIFSNSKLCFSILVIFTIMPIVESLNGRYYGHHISDLYRLLSIGSVAFYLVWAQESELFDKHIFNAINIIFIFTLLTVIQYILFHGQIAIFMNDLKTTFRIILCPLYYAFFLTAIRKGDINKKDLIRLLYLYAVLYASLLIIPKYLGIGYVTYDLQNNSLLSSSSDGIGFKGFFIETNSLVIILIGCLLLVGECTLKEIKKGEVKRSLIGSVLVGALTFSLVLVSTKTGILMAMAYIFVLLLRILINKDIQKKIKILLALLLIILAPIFTPSINQSITDLTQRGSYFYKVFNNDLIRFLTSSRTLYLENTLENISKSKDFFLLSLFGGGYYIDFVRPLEIFKRNLTEMDWFDFYFAYGAIGIVTYFGYFKDNLINFIFSKMSGMKLMFLAFCLYAFFAGHVIFNSMTATFLAIFFAYYIDIDMGLES